MNFKKTVSLILAVMLLLSCMPTGLADTGTVAEGTCGDNLIWILDEDGTLTISGEGAMCDYESCVFVPWYDYCDKISTVIIEQGVTTIGYGAFFECNSLVSVTIPNSVTEIDDSAFDYCDSLSDVYYIGTEEQWNEITIGSYNEYLTNATIHFAENPAVLENIEVTTLPTKTEYFVSEELDLTDMVVKAVYSNGDEIEITDYEVSGFDSTIPGTKTIAVTYGRFTVQFDVTVIGDKYLDLINNWTTFNEVDVVLNEMFNDENIINQYNDFEYYFKKYDSLSKRDIICHELFARQYSSVDEFIHRFIDLVEFYENMDKPVSGGSGVGGGGGGGGSSSTIPDDEEFDEFTLGIGSTKGRSGWTVTVPMYIKKNPGIAGMQLSLEYDGRLTLVGIGQSIGGEYSALEDFTFTFPGDLTANPLTILMDNMEADNSNGEFVLITFEIPQDAEDDTVYDVRVSAANSYVFDNDLNSVKFAVMDGSITVQNYTIGDVNDDGIINIKDVTLLRRGIVGGYGVTLNKAADVNVDGITNIVDITLLRRFIAGGYGVVLDN